MVDASDPSRGILIDLDHAVRRDYPEDGFGYVSLGQRCMAVELLVLKKPPAPTYKHDLESFHWSIWDIVLNWVNGIRVKLDEDEDKDVPYDNYTWGDGSLANMKEAKEAFLRNVGNNEGRHDEETAYSREVHNLLSRFCVSIGGTSENLEAVLRIWADSLAQFYAKKATAPMHRKKVVNGLMRVLRRHQAGQAAL